MATYANSGGALLCLGDDISSADIFSNLNSLGIGSNHYQDTTGTKDVYVFNAHIIIGSVASSGSASAWDCSDQIIKINDNDFQIYGTVQQGNINDGTSESGGAFVVSSAGSNDFRLYENGIFRCYGSMVYANQRIRVDTDSEFTLVDCDAELEDGVSPGESNTAYGDRQAFNFTRTRVHNTGAVGIKLYTFSTGSNAATFVLDGVKVEDCTFGFQTGSGTNLAPVIKDAKIDSCTNHIVPNLGSGSDVTFINPDFTELRAALSASSDVTRICFRYSLNITDSSLSPVENAKVIIVDGNSEEQVNDLTNSLGQISTLPTFDSETVLFNSTYSGTSRTDRATSTRSIATYLYNFRQDTFDVVSDFEDNVALILDSLISNSSKSSVDSYSSIDNSFEFYDRAKSYFLDNYSIGDELLVSREGNTINAGSYNVVIDSLASSVFSFDGSTITILSSEFGGSITTSGSITFLNGASSTGTISDFSGVSVNFSINITDSSDNSNVSDANLYVFANSGGNLPQGSEIINATTDSSGNYSERLNLTPDQPCFIRVRSSSSSGGIFYKSSLSQSTITSQGLTLQVSLDRDE